MDGIRTNAEFGEWRSSFEERVNIITGYKGPVFTVSIWREQKNDKVSHPKAEVVRSSHFMFLDMKMTWSEQGELRFGVYLKLAKSYGTLTATACIPSML